MELSRRFQLPSGELYCRTELLQLLADQAESGYRRTPWGGREIGGILIGQRHGNRVTITGFQALEIEHEFGPSFHLSEKDHETLQHLLDSVAITRVSEVVGWYHSTSRELILDDDARGTNRQFFPHSWQIALVIQRNRNTSAHFGIFCKAQGDAAHAAIDFKLSDISRFPEVAEPTVEPTKPHVPQSQPVEPEQEYADAAIHPSVQAVAHPEVEEAQLPSAPANSGGNSAPEPMAEPTPDPLLAYFGFRYDPFYDDPEPALYCDSPGHRDVLAGLGFSVWSRKGVLLLTGEKGYGKTMLLRCLAQDLKKDSAHYSLLSPAPQSVMALRQSIAKDLELSLPTNGKASLPIALWARGTQCLEQGKNVAILLDDAHLLDASTLAELEALATFGMRKEKTVQLVMTAEPSIEDRFHEPAFRAFAQQIAVRTALRPLDSSETASYIDTRLARAGVTPGVIFPPDAVSAVYERSRGIPSHINTICAAAIRSAFDQRVQQVSSTLVLNAHPAGPSAAENQTASTIG
ncbi:MAG: AAA family ATPase [Bryobacteraceae bacterium]